MRCFAKNPTENFANLQNILKWFIDDEYIGIKWKIWVR